MSTLETAQYYYYGNALASTKELETSARAAPPRRCPCFLMSALVGEHFKVVGDAPGATTAPTSDACC